MSLTLAKQTAYLPMLDPVMAMAKQTAYLVMLPEPDVYTASIAFEGELTLGLTTTGALQYYASIGFEGQLALSIATSGERFACAAPVAKTWTRNTPAEMAWACATVTPALECEGIEDETFDLDLLSGDRLVTVDGFGLKLVN